MALGKALAQQVQRQTKMVDDPLVSEYLNRLCQNLARYSGAEVPLSCATIDGEEPNACAFPGGYIFVYMCCWAAPGDPAGQAGTCRQHLGVPRHVRPPDWSWEPPQDR